MALFSFGKKDNQPESPAAVRTEPGTAAPAAQAAAPTGRAGEEKNMLRMIALDAARRVDLADAIKGFEVVTSRRGLILLVKLQDYIHLTEVQLINRQRAFERRCGISGHSHNVTILDIYWAMPLSMIQGEQGATETQFAVSQMGDFSASQFGGMGGHSAFYPDADLVEWNAQDLPKTGEVRKSHSADSTLAPPDF